MRSLHVLYAAHVVLVHHTRRTIIIVILVASITRSDGRNVCFVLSPSTQEDVMEEHVVRYMSLKLIRYK